MKQKFFYLGIVLLAGMFSFISCSKDDDDSDNTDEGNEFYEKGVATVEGDVVVYKSGHSIIKYYFEDNDIVKIEATLNCSTEEAANNQYQDYWEDPYAAKAAKYLDLKKNGKYLIGTDDNSIYDTFRGFTKEQVANLLNTVPVQTLSRNRNRILSSIRYFHDCEDSSIANTLHEIYLKNTEYENVTVEGNYLSYSATEKTIESYKIHTEEEWTDILDYQNYLDNLISFLCNPE